MNCIGNTATPAIPASLTETQATLYETEEYFCPLCNKSDYEDPAMVACDACDKWYHCICVVSNDEFLEQQW